MDGKYIVHDRVGPHGTPVPIDPNSVVDIPEEYYDTLERIQEAVERLNNARHELGRLEQVKYHLIYVCNNAENISAEEKKKLLESIGLTDVGNYAIDFERKQVSKVIQVDSNKAPRVVGG